MCKGILLSADFKSYGPGSDLDASFSLEELRSFRMEDGVVFAVVGHNLQSRVISEVWLGDFKTEDRLRGVVSFILEQLETGAYEYWLADFRFLVSLLAPNEDWFFQTVMPTAFSLGVKRFAMVFPEKTDIAPTRSDAMEEAEIIFRKVTHEGLGLFEDIDVARKWLLTGQ